jgi:ABC-type dipeptide/oligopeptide/nickel transport system permease subunit
LPETASSRPFGGEAAPARTLVPPAGGPAAASRGQVRMAAERFVRHKLAMTGLAVFVALVLLSVIGPLVWKYGYAQITSQFGTAPSAQHPFGTDTIGHDMFAQVLEGLRTSLETALLVAAISTVIGTLIGAIAGYYGGIWDQIMMRLTDLVLIFPVLAILLVLSNRFSKQSDSSLFVGLMLAVLFWTYLARLVRGTFMGTRRPCRGCSTSRRRSSCWPSSR